MPHLWWHACMCCTWEINFINSQFNINYLFILFFFPPLIFKLSFWKPTHTSSLWWWWDADDDSKNVIKYWLLPIKPIHQFFKIFITVHLWEINSAKFIFFILIFFNLGWGGRRGGGETYSYLILTLYLLKWFFFGNEFWSMCITMLLLYAINIH